MRNALITLFALLWAAAAFGANRTVEIFQGRQVTIAAPTGWTFEATRDEKTGVQTMVLDDPSGEIKLALSFLPDSTNRLASKAAVEAQMQAVFADMLQGAVETEMKIVITEAPGGGFEGHTIFTDRQFIGREIPKDERRLATAGIRSWPGFFAVFTILSNDSTSDAYNAALKLVQSGVTAVVNTTEPDRITVVERPDVYELMVPVSNLVLSIPKQGLVQKTDKPQGRRYFYFMDEKRSRIVSGWFEPAEEFSGIEKFWKAETSAWSANKLPQPDNVAFRKIGRWDTIVYHMPRSGGGFTHIRAHWVQAGTWIDLHLSSPDAKELESFLGQIAVREK